MKKLMLYLGISVLVLLLNPTQVLAEESVVVASSSNIVEDVDNQEITFQKKSNLVTETVLENKEQIKNDAEERTEIEDLKKKLDELAKEYEESLLPYVYSYSGKLEKNIIHLNDSRDMSLDTIIRNILRIIPEPPEGLELRIEGIPFSDNMPYRKPQYTQVYDPEGNFIEERPGVGAGYAFLYLDYSEPISYLNYYDSYLLACSIHPVRGITKEVEGTMYTDDKTYWHFVEGKVNKKASSLSGGGESYSKYLNPNIYGGTWVSDGNLWRLRSENGSYARSQWAYVNGKWYLFDANGYMLTGWQKVDEKWYLLSVDGSMLTGWQQIRNDWYYLTENGDMLVDTVTPDGFKVDISGKWID